MPVRPQDPAIPIHLDTVETTAETGGPSDEELGFSLAHQRLRRSRSGGLLVCAIVVLSCICNLLIPALLWHSSWWGGGPNRDIVALFSASCLLVQIETLALWLVFALNSFHWRFLVTGCLVLLVPLTIFLGLAIPANRYPPGGFFAFLTCASVGGYCLSAMFLATYRAVTKYRLILSAAPSNEPAGSAGFSITYLVILTTCFAVFAAIMRYIAPDITEGGPKGNEIWETSALAVQHAVFATLVFASIATSTLQSNKNWLGGVGIILTLTVLLPIHIYALHQYRNFQAPELIQNAIAFTIGEAVFSGIFCYLLRLDGYRIARPS